MPDNLTNKVVTLARSYIGKVKYVFGADDVEGGRADCSAFTRYIFKQAGYDIPRTTGAVWVDESLPTIAKQDLRPGDLVLFKDTYDSGYKNGVSHIGIYSGNGKFIHCTNSAGGGVMESSLASMKDHWLGGKRVIGAAESSGADKIPENLGTGQSSGQGKAPDIPLVWWGDILKVVLITIILIAGGIFAALAVKEVAN